MKQPPNSPCMGIRHELNNVYQLYKCHQSSMLPHRACFNTITSIVIHTNMSALTQEQANSFIEKIGQVFDVPIFTEADANRLLSQAKASLEWEAAIKEELTNAGLPPSTDQIQLLPCNPTTNPSILSLESLAPLFTLYNLEADKENLDALVHNVSVSKSLDDTVTDKLMGLGLPVNSENVSKLSVPSKNEDCVSYTAPFPRDFYMLDEVRTLRPEYLIGTWFNTQNRPFKFNMELDWVNRLAYNNDCFLPKTPMSISFFSSTGENIWDFISEVHVHRTAMNEFTHPRDGWIEAPRGAAELWRAEASDTPLNFIERLIRTPGSRTIVALKSGTGGWATFEHVRNSDVTAAAARLLFKFSDPLYCARSDGKVVIKLTNSTQKLALLDKKNFPSGRVSVNNQNKFPVCIP